MHSYLMSLSMYFCVDLGHQTAQRIVHGSEPLQSMLEINQNFPSIVSSLSRMKVVCKASHKLCAYFSAVLETQFIFTYVLCIIIIANMFHLVYAVE